MNLPNRLTILRVCLVPLFVITTLCAAIPGHEYFAITFFSLACITDFFDGYLARKYNQVTVLGKFMDPLADKLLIVSALVCFLADGHNEMPAWIVIVIISREFIISGFRIVAAEQGVTIAANYWGKVKTVVQMGMCMLLIVHFEAPVFRILDQIAIYASLTLTVISLLVYIYQNRGILKGNK